MEDQSDNFYYVILSFTWSTTGTARCPEEAALRNTAI